MKPLLMLLGCLLAILTATNAPAQTQTATGAASPRPVPDKLVVLTFDDAVSNHATLAGPLLKRYGFGATFYVCEFPPDFATNKQQYMTWEQIAGLDRMGFEIGNHTGHHTPVRGRPEDNLEAELEFIERRCADNGITTPTTFCYPGGSAAPEALPAAFPVLRAKGYRFARCGGDRAYRPGEDSPLLVPSFGIHGDNPQKFYDAVAQARDGRIVVLMLHGIPEYTHPWVNTQPALFEEYMKYLHDNGFTVIAMRDLARYVAP